jgi:hypothetical protein
LVSTTLKCPSGLYLAMSTCRIRTKVEIVRLCGSNSPFFQAIMFDFYKPLYLTFTSQYVPTIFDQEKSSFSSKLLL